MTSATQVRRTMLLTCQVGFESLLKRELAELHGAEGLESGSGWVRIDGGAASGGSDPAVARGSTLERALPALAFAHLSILAPIELRGESVNALAARIAEYFLTSLRDERVDAPWPSVWLGPQDVVGLGRRISAVESAWAEIVKKRFSRVARLATTELPRGMTAQKVRGLFVFWADFGRVFVAREAFVHGQRRMADDDLAPSRSYLKIEEAFLILGRDPQAGDTVCDLGAAPGGWSYSAAKRGARVLAIDNGPLKGGALDHPQIEHRREDAFRFVPTAAGATGVASAVGAEAEFDWLFCDLVEDPHHVLQHLVEPWLAGRWCRRFVVNLKFGRVDPIAFVAELRGPASPFTLYAREFRLRHLYHDREELTVVGEVRSR